MLWIPQLLPAKRQDVDGGFKRRRSDVRLSVGDYDDRFLCPGPRVQQGLVDGDESVVGGRISVRKFPRDDALEALEHRTLRFLVGRSVRLQVVEIDVDCGTVGYDGDASVVLVDCEMLKNILLKKR